MMERLAFWYWGWFGDALARDFEKGLSDEELPFMTFKEFLELVALLLCFPIGAVSMVWVTEVRGQDLESRLRASHED